MAQFGLVSAALAPPALPATANWCEAYAPRSISWQRSGRNGRYRLCGDQGAGALQVGQATARTVSEGTERQVERNVAIDRAWLEVAILCREPDPEHVLIGADLRNRCQRSIHADL